MAHRSITYLGVRLVPFGTAVRKATKVVQDGVTLALLPDGSVACSSKEVFRYAYTTKTSKHIHIAGLLCKLGCVSKAAYQALEAEYETENKRRHLGYAAADLASAAKAFGVTLTKAQQNKISAARVKS